MRSSAASFAADPATEGEGDGTSLGAAVGDGEADEAAEADAGGVVDDGTATDPHPTSRQAAMTEQATGAWTFIADGTRAGLGEFSPAFWLSGPTRPGTGPAVVC
jgi:hypothetical protein